MTCTKRAYKSKRAAMRSVSIARSKGWKMCAYKCRDCKKWHMATGDHNLSPAAYYRSKDPFPNLLK